MSLGGIYHSIIGFDKLEETTYGIIFHFNWKDRYKISSILGAHLGAVGIFSFCVILKSCYFGGLYDTLCPGGGDIRLVKDYDISINLFVILKYLFRSPFGSEGWIISVNNLEDVIGGHYWISVISFLGSWWHIQTRPYKYFIRSFLYTSEAYLSYSLAALSLFGFNCSIFSWYNLNFYPSEFYGPTGPEASQAQSFTFLIRDQKLGVKISSSQGPTSLPKYIMRSPSGELIFGGETMRFWTLQAAWIEPLRCSVGLDIKKIKRNIQIWQERRSSEFMTHAPLGSLNSVGGVATEINSVNYVSPRSWLTSTHWILSFIFIVGHWWHSSRSKIIFLSGVRGLSRQYEPVFFLRPID